MLVAALEQHDERLRADTADSDDFARDVDDLEPLQQVATVVLQCGAVGAELFVDHVFDFVARHAGRSGQVADRDDHGGLADDPVLTVDVLGELRECLQAVAGVRFLDGLLGLLFQPFAFRTFQFRCGVAHGLQHVVGRDVRVPDVHRVGGRERGHCLPIGPHRRRRRDAHVGLCEGVVAGRDREARCHPLHVILEWTGKSLVEVVHIEQQRAFGRREDAEVRQVRVAAELDGQPCGRSVRSDRRP